MLSFCNDWTDKITYDYTAVLEPWAKKDLCILAKNDSSEDIVIQYSFPKASFSPWWNQICELWDDFSKFFLENSNRTLVVSWLSTVVLKETIFAPIGMSWMSYGCLVYQVADVNSNNWWMFNFVVRKALNLKLFIWGESTIDKSLEFLTASWSIYSMNKNISAGFNEYGDLFLNLNVKNKWNITQNISLEGVVSNFLGFQKEFSIPIKKVMPGELYSISQKIWILPSYKWLFSIALTLKGEPVFEFDPSSIDDKYKQPIVIREETSIFVFSWIYVVIAIFVILFLIKILIPKKKKIINNSVNTPINTTITQ